MSKTNLFIAAMTGATLASGTWYVATNNTANAAPATENESMMATRLHATGTPCPEVASHTISFADAQNLVRNYVATTNPAHLTYDGTNTLKGWYIERCIIEDLFSRYPNADGLQLYVGLKETTSGTSVNSLVWMASQPIEENGSPSRENCISLPNSIMDMAAFCPLNCPKKNDLP